MSGSMTHHEEPGAIGPHTDSLTSTKDFPEPDQWSSDGQWNPH